MSVGTSSHTLPSRLTRSVLFTTFHYMTRVHMHIDRAEGLADAYEMASYKLRRATYALSPLVIEAFELLNGPGQSPEYGPIPALRNLSSELRDERQDVSWRADRLRADDRLLAGPYSRLAKPTSLNIAVALAKHRLAAAQALLARRLMNKGLAFADAVKAAQSDDTEGIFAALRLGELNKAILEATRTDPARVALVKERAEIFSALRESERPVPSGLASVLVQQLTPRQILAFEQSHPDVFREVVAENGVPHEQVTGFRADLLSGVLLDNALATAHARESAAERIVELNFAIEHWEGDRDAQFHAKVDELKAATRAAQASYVSGGAVAAAHATALRLQGLQQVSTREVVVQAGDSLSAIARDAGLSLDELLALNPQYRANPGLIHPGDVVVIGTGSAAATTAASPAQSAAPLQSAVATTPSSEITTDLNLPQIALTLPNLSWGNAGPLVGYLQQALNVLIGAGLVVDGDFGPLTQQAVRDFQAANGLAVDGIVGPNTWTEILTVLSAGGHTNLLIEIAGGTTGTAPAVSGVAGGAVPISAAANANVGQFMAGIRFVESSGNYQAVGADTRWGPAGGAYQFIQDTWDRAIRTYAPQYSSYIGVHPSNVPPYVQDAVAEAWFSGLFARYGTWDLVAVAHFAGEGRANDVERGANVSGITDVLGTSIAEYVRRVLMAMGVSSTTQTAPAPVQVNQSTARASTGAGQVTVRSGDTLSAIARNNGISLAVLLAHNPQIADPNRIQVGDVVYLPGSATAPASTTSPPATSSVPASNPGSTAGPVTVSFPVAGSTSDFSDVAARLSQLSWGDAGPLVGYVQQALNVLIGAGLVVDNEFGPATNQAVRDYQAANGLVVDGIIGPNTWAHILADLDAGGHDNILNQITGGSAIAAAPSDPGSASAPFPVTGVFQVTVRAGQTAFGIAQAHGITLDILEQHNPHIPDLGRLNVGDVLNIPSGTASSPAAPATIAPGSSVSGVIMLSSTNFIAWARAQNPSAYNQERERVNDAQRFVSGSARSVDLQTAYNLVISGAVVLPQGSWVQTSATSNQYLYSVKPGDSLSSIARMFGVDLDEIKQADGSAATANLHPGDVLRIAGTLAPAQVTVPLDPEPVVRAPDAIIAPEPVGIFNQIDWIWDQLEPYYATPLGGFENPRVDELEAQLRPLLNEATDNPLQATIMRLLLGDGWSAEDAAALAIVFNENDPTLNASDVQELVASVAGNFLQAQRNGSNPRQAAQIAYNSLNDEPLIRPQDSLVPPPSLPEDEIWVPTFTGGVLGEALGVSDFLLAPNVFNQIAGATGDRDRLTPADLRLIVANPQSWDATIVGYATVLLASYEGDRRVWNMLDTGREFDDFVNATTFRFSTDGDGQISIQDVREFNDNLLFWQDIEPARRAHPEWSGLSRGEVIDRLSADDIVAVLSNVQNDRHRLAELLLEFAGRINSIAHENFLNGGGGFPHQAALLGFIDIAVRDPELGEHVDAWASRTGGAGVAEVVTGGETDPDDIAQAAIDSLLGGNSFGPLAGPFFGQDFQQILPHLLEPEVAAAFINAVIAGNSGDLVGRIETIDDEALSMILVNANTHWNRVGGTTAEVEIGDWARAMNGALVGPKTAAASQILASQFGLTIAFDPGFQWGDLLGTGRFLLDLFVIGDVISLVEETIFNPLTGRDSSELTIFLSGIGLWAELGHLLPTPGLEDALNAGAAGAKAAVRTLENLFPKSVMDLLYQLVYSVRDDIGKLVQRLEALIQMSRFTEAAARALVGSVRAINRILDFPTRVIDDLVNIAKNSEDISQFRAMVRLLNASDASGSAAVALLRKYDFPDEDTVMAARMVFRDNVTETLLKQYPDIAETVLTHPKWSELVNYLDANPNQYDNLIGGLRKGWDADNLTGAELEALYRATVNNANDAPFGLSFDELAERNARWNPEKNVWDPQPGPAPVDPIPVPPPAVGDEVTEAAIRAQARQLDGPLRSMERSGLVGNADEILAASAQQQREIADFNNWRAANPSKNMDDYVAQRFPGTDPSDFSHRSNLAEMVVDQQMIDNGWLPADSLKTSLPGGAGQGIDHVYVKVDADGDITEVFVLETKSGNAGLDTGQMSREWIEGPELRDSRLNDALTEDALDAVTFTGYTPVLARVDLFGEVSLEKLDDLRTVRVG